jgi:hypothetical protein
MHYTDTNLNMHPTLLSAAFLNQPFTGNPQLTTKDTPSLQKTLADISKQQLSENSYGKEAFYTTRGAKRFDSLTRFSARPGY